MVKRMLASILVGTLAAEVLPGHDRDQPHTDVAEQEQPLPVGAFSVSGLTVTSTGSSSSSPIWSPYSV